MKPKRPGSRRKKIILYYILAVVLPGIVLGYLAYRGIRNDQALREKENLRKLEVSHQAFFDAIDSSFVDLMNEQTAHSVLTNPIQDKNTLLALLITDTSGSKELVSHQLLYLPDELLMAEYGQPAPSFNLKDGLRLEYAEHRYSEALRYYKDRILHTTDSPVKIQTLVASARLYNKMNQPVQARAIYNEIRKDYPGSLLNGEIPLALMASLEIQKINQSMGEKDEMINNSLQCLELLLNPSCEYDKNQFDLFYQSFREIIRETDPVTDSLFLELDHQRARTDFIILIITRPDLTGTGNYDYVTDRKNGITIVPANSPELTAVFLSRKESNGLKISMVIDFPAYLKSISGSLIQKLDPDSSMNMKIEDNNGKPVVSRIMNEETGYMAFPFPENLPKWRLLLSESKPGFMATLLKAGSGIYLFIFILIALLMALGFIFTIYTLNIELRLNKLKSEFISNVSHELKSPLTSIRVMTELLHHGRVRTEERKSAYYSAMLQESEHLSHLIDNILDFSRIDEDLKKYDFIDLNLDELLMKFLESTRERLADPGFNIRYNRPDHVSLIRADKDAILQVIYNLVDNAIKFSGESKQIDINLFSKDDEVQLCVKDYGIGISVKDQEKIFDRFYRGDEPQQLGIKGSGIGLTIVKKIIEVHKGRLTLESSPGEGSTFCVHLPIHENTEL